MKGDFVLAEIGKAVASLGYGHMFAEMKDFGLVTLHFIDSDIVTECNKGE